MMTLINIIILIILYRLNRETRRDSEAMIKELVLLRQEADYIKRMIRRVPDKVIYNMFTEE